MAWKSSFRQNYRTTFSPTVPPSAAGISHVAADVEAPGGEKWEHLKRGESNGKLPLRELAQDAACQRHTSRLTELWSLPRPAQKLNTNNNNNNNNNNLINGTIFRKKLPNTKCIFLFPLQLLPETFLILRRTERDMIKIYIGLHVRYTLSDFNENFIFSTHSRTILKYQIS